MKPCTETCHRDPRKCPHAVEDYDGDSYYSGLPIRTYWPDEDCPFVALNEATYRYNWECEKHAIEQLTGSFFKPLK